MTPPGRWPTPALFAAGACRPRAGRGRRGDRCRARDRHDQAGAPGCGALDGDSGASDSSGPRVTRTLDRRGLWAVQTPQVFRRGHSSGRSSERRRAARAATDDAWLVERQGVASRSCPRRRRTSRSRRRSICGSRSCCSASGSATDERHDRSRVRLPPLRGGAAADHRRSRGSPHPRPARPLRRRRAHARDHRRAARGGRLGDIGEHFPDTDERLP